jgi:hypothetical protein
MHAGHRMIGNAIEKGSNDAARKEADLDVGPGPRDAEKLAAPALAHAYRQSAREDRVLSIRF